MIPRFRKFLFLVVHFWNTKYWGTVRAGIEIDMDFVPSVHFLSEAVREEESNGTVDQYVDDTTSLNKRTDKDTT